MDLGSEGAPATVPLSQKQDELSPGQACREGAGPEVCARQRRPESQLGPALRHLEDRRLESPCGSLGVLPPSSSVCWLRLLLFKTCSSPIEFCTFPWT